MKSTADTDGTECSHTVSYVHQRLVQTGSAIVKHGSIVKLLLVHTSWYLLAQWRQRCCCGRQDLVHKRTSFSSLSGSLPAWQPCVIGGLGI